VARRARARALAAACIAAGAAAPTAAQDLVAERITPANAARLQVAGPDADAGIGDWFLGNGTLCAAVSDPDHESPLSPRGGVLIDLFHCGRADDQWAVWQPLLNLSQGELVPVESVEAGREADRAWLRTRARYRGVEIETTYAVGRAEPTALAIALRARSVAAGEPVFGIGAIALHAGGQLSAFSLARGALVASRGFEHPPNDRSSTRKLLASLADADVTVLVGGEDLPPISYGIERVRAGLVRGAGLGARSRPASDEALSTFTLIGGHYTLENALVAPPWIGRASGRPGFLQLAQIPFMDLEPGTELALEHRLWLGERADVASVTDRLFAGEALVRGLVDDPEARVHFTLLEDAEARRAEAGAGAVSEIAPDAEGRFALRLPPGRYRALARAPAGRTATIEFAIPAAAPEPEAANDRAGGPSAEPPTLELPLLDLGTPGRVELPEGFIGRLVFLASADGSPVRFGGSRLGFRIGDEPIPAGTEAAFLNVVPSADGRPRVIAVPPGDYRVVATRGPEYAARELDVAVHAGRTVVLALEPLPRVAPTPGWIAADLHVHSAQSFDSAVPEARQIEAFAASGAELLVATEHDRIFDPRPAIEARGLAGELAGVAGSEITSAWAGGDAPYSSGHLNAFPLTPDPTAFRRGALRFEGRRLRDLLAELRGQERPPLVQLNHPRPEPDSDGEDTYFGHLGVAGEPLDPTRPLAARPNAVLLEPGAGHGVRDLDVDAVELMNAGSLVRYRRTRADWLAFLLQGERIVGTANSDSHRLGHVVGLPRTYVRVVDDRVAAFDEEAFVAALRAGRAYGTTGPLLNVRLGLSGVGERHTGAKGVLQIAVDAAEWVPIAEWRAYVNGELVHRAPIGRGGSDAVPLAFAADAFVTVEVEGPPEGLYRDALPGFVPFAFANPIFVDADADGRWTAPGLPAPAALPPTITDPERAD